ncbi:RagB/SusD family nutrient uptake outer membrane protein, partial [Pedobacter sp.]|uniref:RagB/SusD family nutrient uptake outer membrane protein n=1 Tax=Pedobacter sp. TaxID=1411316 RepID=UPI002B798D6F
MKKKHNHAAHSSYYIFTVFVLILVCLEGIGCKKFIEVGAPVTSVNGENVYTDDANAISAVTGIFTKMSNSNFTLNLSLFPALSVDDFKLSSLDNTAYDVYNQNSLISNYGSTTDLWNSTYNYIYLANAGIEGLNKSNTITPSVKQRLQGEVYFTRAFCYFYLVNLYGNVPLALGTDYTVNIKLSRTDIQTVYQQIIADLLQAKSLLDDSYVDGSLLKSTTERVRPNRMAVNALLSRVYLFTKN